MIELFSTDCPRCKVLEKKLADANFKFVKQNDLQEVIDAGFTSAPVLKINNTYYDFKQAIDWLNDTATPVDECEGCNF